MAGSCRRLVRNVRNRNSHRVSQQIASQPYINLLEKNGMIFREGINTYGNAKLPHRGGLFQPSVATV